MGRTDLYFFDQEHNLATSHTSLIHQFYFSYFSSQTICSPSFTEEALELIIKMTTCPFGICFSNEPRWSHIQQFAFKTMDFIILD